MAGAAFGWGGMTPVWHALAFSLAALLTYVGVQCAAGGGGAG